MNGVLLTLGNFEIKWYSVLIVIGVIIGYSGVVKESSRFKIDKNFITNLIFWTVIFGIIGSRLYYVAFSWDYYSVNLNEIYQIWNGGLAIHGAILFGVITILIYCKKYKVSTSRVMDIMVPFLLLAQAIGRWGNFFNAEAYGTVTTYETLKSLFIPEFVIKGMYINGNYYLPMFYFESLWCLIGFIVLMIVRRTKYVKKGQLTAIYLMWYSFGRFIIEIFRTDALLVGDARVAQLVSIGIFIIGFVVLLIQSRKPKLEELYNDNNDIKEIKF